MTDHADLIARLRARADNHDKLMGNLAYYGPIDAALDRAAADALICPVTEAARLSAVIERDRTTVADGIQAIRKAISSHEWLRLGRGSYEWDDDRWKDEFGAAIDAIETALDPLRKVAIDWSDCPTRTEEIMAARRVNPAARPPVTEEMVERMAAWLWGQTGDGVPWADTHEVNRHDYRLDAREALTAALGAGETANQPATEKGGDANSTGPDASPAAGLHASQPRSPDPAGGADAKGFWRALLRARADGFITMAEAEAAYREFKRERMDNFMATAAAPDPAGGAEIGPSVAYREGAPAVADYDEAIEELRSAREQIANGDWMGCAVCGDSDHDARRCQHNVLVLARRWSAATRVWQCWHCGFIATNDEEGRAHFGQADDDVPSCREATIRAEATKAERERCATRIDELIRLLEMRGGVAGPVTLATLAAAIRGGGND